MKSLAIRVQVPLLVALISQALCEIPGEEGNPEQGKSASYVIEKAGLLAADVVKSFTVSWGPVQRGGQKDLRWFSLRANKVNGEVFQFWLLTDGYPLDMIEPARRHTARYILQHGVSGPEEFRDRFSGEPVLPSLGGWHYLIPRPIAEKADGLTSEIFTTRSRYLGHLYRHAPLDENSPPDPPPSAHVFELLPNLLIGVPSNKRQKMPRRRFDGSDYEYIPLSREDFREMADAGMNCFRVDSGQLPLIADLDVFYWGIGGNNVPFPECLYDSRYLGSQLFLDEPAVCTRDYVIRPKLAKDESFRKSLTPQIAFDAFRDYYRHAWEEGAPAGFLKECAARSEVDLGDLHFLQENLFSWDTMVSTAAYQLSQNPSVPAAMVFEPPGRVGTKRTLPELDMTYGCQIPVDDPKNLTSIIYGFLRGAARLTGKTWGTSIYGAVDRADGPWFLNHAHDLGATRFFFWDNAGIACVPYPECVALARILTARGESNPNRDILRLNHAAEVAILLPPGYNLGHVHLGKGSLWGLGELNLERINSHGIKYRTVMSNFFAEIERCLRLGVAFDLMWDLPSAQPAGYREVVRIREDGKVELVQDGRSWLWDQARIPIRPLGALPNLAVTLSTNKGTAPLFITARANVTETTAPIYYTFGADKNGVYHNAVAAWEIYGPGEEDYRFLSATGSKPRVVEKGNRYEVEIEFKLDRPGNYRLRTATVDLAGRSTVMWTPIIVGN